MKKLLFISVLFIASIIDASVLNVPSAVYSTIQSAIDSSSDGDTVLVAPGEYLENINFNSKNILLTSNFILDSDTSFISSTIINGNQSGSVVTFNSGEDSTAQLIGFTIINGRAGHGAGIFCKDSRPTLKYLSVSNNSAQGGAGIYIKNSTSSLENITIKKCKSEGSDWDGGGGGMSILNSDLLVNNLIVTSNIANRGAGLLLESSNSIFNNLLVVNNYSYAANYGSWGHAAAIILENSSPIINKATITQNECQQFPPMGNRPPGVAAIELHYNSNPKIINSIIWNNYPNEISGNAKVFFSNIMNGWEGEGNSAIDPIFVNPDSNDFSLSPNSSLIDKGIAYFSYSDTILVDMDESDYLGSAPDMGYYEFDKTNSVDDDSHPNSFRLRQNYPNPFNPTTKIKYTIPSVGNENFRSVQLKVYDVLGKEVATLVNKEQSAGNYEVEFNASNLTSGVYFYRIIADSFVETKKMLLLR